MSFVEELTLNDLEEVLESDRKVVVSLDVDNPVKEPGPHMEPHEGVKSSIAELQELADAVTFNSGKPVAYQRKMREKYSETHPEISDVDIIGGLGTVAEIDGGVHHFGDGGITEFIELQEDLFSLIAENGWKAHLQNNQGYDVGVTRLEAEGGYPHSRGYSRANPMFSDATTGSIFRNYFSETEDFDINPGYEREIVGTGAIQVKDSRENLNYLIDVMRTEEPFLGLRFERTEDGRIAFYRDQMDRSLNEQKLREQVEKIVEGTEWKVTFHDDGGVEYWREGAGKTQGLESYLEERYDGDAVAVHIGDRESDLIDSPRVITVPQQDTELYDSVDYDFETPDDVSELPQYLRRGV